MSRARRVCVVTGSRAEWGLLQDLVQALQAAAAVDVQLLVTGSHLAAQHGATIAEIEASGIRVDHCVHLLQAAGAGVDVAGSCAAGAMPLLQALREGDPEVVVVLGDRYETFLVAALAFLDRRRIAHIHGGEVTAGAVDDGLRHAISKLASWHFPCSPVYAARLAQMGEPQARIVVAGALGSRRLAQGPQAGAAVLARLGLRLESPLVLLTQHPSTAHPGRSEDEVAALCAAVRALAPGTLVVSGPNADHEGERLRPHLADLCAELPNAALVANLGRQRYHDLLGIADLMVGNSSSGLLEAYLYRLPVVDVGDRQTGRLRSANVLHVPATIAAVLQAMRQALAPGFRRGLPELDGIYGAGDAAERIADTLATAPLPTLAKDFIDGPVVEQLTAAWGQGGGAWDR